MKPRQFYLTLFIFVISLRVQKMPSIIAGYLGKDGYLLILFYFLVDLVGISLAFLILKCKKQVGATQPQSAVASVIKGIGFFAAACYFMFQCTLLYEAVQDLFAHILFDNLSWTLFSLLLIVAIFLIAHGGLKTIGRLMEIFFFVIVISYAIIMIFGAMQTNFSSILPFETINFNLICDNFVKFNLWFGDFFLVLFLGSKSDGIKLKWTLLTYSLSMVVVILLMVEFYGIFSVFSPVQPSLITVVSEMSMLGVDVGRVDWFLILFTEIGTIVCSALCLFFAKDCVSVAIPKLKPVVVLLLLILILYLGDVIFLVDTNIKELFFLNITSLYSIVLKVGFFVIVLILSLSKYCEKKKQKAVAK